MATVLGAPPEFDGNTEDWEIYTERLSHYLVANDITDKGKKRSVLISACGSTTYKLMKSLVAPASVTTLKYNELVALVQGHYNPKPSVIVMRFKFNSCLRQSGESVAAYLARLRELAQHCAYGSTLDEMLRDRLVCGIQDDQIQRTLLAKSDLTLQKAFELAQLQESAEANAKTLSNRTSQLQVSWTPAEARNEAPSPRRACYRCGSRGHGANSCRFKDLVCNFCRKRGHIARACRARKNNPSLVTSQNQSRQQPAHHLAEEATEDSTASVGDTPTTDGEGDYPFFQVVAKGVYRVAPFTVSVVVNGTPLNMEVDTGAALSLISKATYDAAWSTESAPKLQPATVSLRTYTGEPLTLVGTAMVSVEYRSQQEDLSLLVVEGSGPSLLGRDWLEKIRLDWSALHSIRSQHTVLNGILEKHSDLFKEELGKVRGRTAKIHVDPQAKPRFFKPRSVPYALRGKVEQALDRMVKEGVIEAVECSEWAAPIVPVLKRDGSIRVCGDYKTTINQAMIIDSYPLPRIEDIFASLSEGKTFSKLDLAHAYQQLPLDDTSKSYVVINTHKGLFQFNRLPFGVSSAPAIFQRTIESILAGLPHVSVYLDDILITGESEAAHLRNLEAVLHRLKAAGLRLKREKCQFMLRQVEYLGHRISAAGLHPSVEKVRAIVSAPSPISVPQLKSYLGLLNYYSKFLPNLSTQLSPLYELLQKNRPWSWGKRQQEAFQQSKAMLTESSLLVHYDAEKPLLLSCDASPYGVGAVLSHRMEDGTDQPISYASRSLSPAERKYSQLDKEALAIIFAVKRFHQFIYGRHFTIILDHQPLKYLFGEHRGVPTLASGRIQRWALTLGAYNYSIVFKPGELHGNADGLSRLPLPDQPLTVPLPGDMVLLFDMLEQSPITAEQISKWTDKDPVLARVRNNVRNGWDDTDDSLQAYQSRRLELSVQDGCVLLGSRVIVPKPGQGRILQYLHEGHPGMVRMKRLARGYVWWPGLGEDIENHVKQCTKCQQAQKMPAVAPLHPWEWPERPWSRLHVDYAGPIKGKMFLVIVDAYSKWLEVHATSTATSQVTMDKLRSTFAVHGLPDMLVTDNGSVFTSAEFELFCKRNGIKHVTSSPYHPSSNGLAERAVQTLKTALKKGEGNSLECTIARFLFQYRLTPHSTTGVSPAELLLNRRPRSLLDCLRPSIGRRVRQSQERQKAGHDARAHTRTLVIGERVLVRNFRDGSKWLTGVVVEVLGPLTYLIRLDSGPEVQRHIDHIRSHVAAETVAQESMEDVGSCSDEEDPGLVDTPENAVPESENQHADAEEAEHEGTSLRRSTRVRQPPDRLMWSTSDGPS